MKAAYDANKTAGGAANGAREDQPQAAASSTSGRRKQAATAAGGGSKRSSVPASVGSTCNQLNGHSAGRSGAASSPAGAKKQKTIKQMFDNAAGGAIVVGATIAGSGDEAVVPELL